MSKKFNYEWFLLAHPVTIYSEICKVALTLPVTFFLLQDIFPSFWTSLPISLFLHPILTFLLSALLVPLLRDDLLLNDLLKSTRGKHVNWERPRHLRKRLEQFSINAGQSNSSLMLSVCLGQAFLMAPKHSVTANSQLFTIFFLMAAEKSHYKNGCNKSITVRKHGDPPLFLGYLHIKILCTRETDIQNCFSVCDSLCLICIFLISRTMLNPDFSTHDSKSLTACVPVSHMLASLLWCRMKIYQATIHVWGFVWQLSKIRPGNMPRPNVRFPSWERGPEI